MACYHPMIAYRPREGKKLVFNPRDGYIDLPVTIPCGQCIGCRLERSRQWAMRCMHEAQLHEVNSFLTLTYSDEHLPENKSLNKKHMTDFIKRLRHHIQPTKIRYFQCGEYGAQTHRPHHHMILFGYDFADKRILKNGQNKLYNSLTLDKLWSFGHCSIGAVSFDSAAYVAAYTVDKLNGELGKAAYEDQGRIPPYVTMSRRPGIAADWLAKYESDVYDHDYVVIRNGLKCKPPKFYDRLFDEWNPGDLPKIKAAREALAKSRPDFGDGMRLRVKELCVLEKKDKYSREIT